MAGRPEPEELLPESDESVSERSPFLCLRDFFLDFLPRLVFLVRASAKRAERSTSARCPAPLKAALMSDCLYTTA